MNIKDFSIHETLELYHKHIYYGCLHEIQFDYKLRLFIIMDLIQHAIGNNL
jgi:hypothetical protein